MNTVLIWLAKLQALISLWTYWLPMAVCLIVYTCRMVRSYREDLDECTKPFYTPRLTVGVIVWHLIKATVPVINLLALILDCASSVFAWLESSLRTVLNTPLVRRKRT